jgi:hypothetical protein
MAYAPPRLGRNGNRSRSRKRARRKMREGMAKYREERTRA